MKPKLIFIFAVVFTLIPLLLLFAPILINYNKTAKNTSVLGKNYSGLNRQEIINRLDSDFVLPEIITLTSPQKNYEINIASVSAKINKDKIASNILYRRLNQGIVPYIKYFFSNKNFNLEISYDSNKMNAVLSELASQIDKPFVPSEVQLVGNNIIVTQGQLGQKLNQNSLKSEIIYRLSTWTKDSPLPLLIETIGSLPDDTQIESTKLLAQKFIGKQLILATDTDNIPLDDQTILGWMGFNNNYIDQDLIDFADSIDSSIKRDPVNAVFKVENDKVLEFKPAMVGITLDHDKFIHGLKESLNNLAQSNDKTFTYQIPVKTTPPLVTTEDANNLGIKELLGEGSSTFKHSSTIRNYNVEKGASIVNRILVAPGDTFSFVNALGEVSKEAGYKDAYIIRAGRTELDVGGGICQVSTTFFRAMLNAGLDIRERRNHAYRVSYYEEDMPPGYDATVFIPKPDLTFVNDTGNYLLIQNDYDGVNKKLTYRIYGTSDGRKAEISNYRQWGASPPPPDIHIDDPTLPPGKTIQDERAIPGLKTAFDWKVTKNGEILHQKTFTSSFAPWAAVYRHGPSI